MPSKRLCLFLNSWTYGGVEEHVALLCEQLPALGYEPLVVCSDTEALRTWRERLSALGVPITLLSEGHSPREKVHFVTELVRLLRRERIDVLHLQLIYFDGGKLPMLAGSLARVPMVVTHHAAPRGPVPAKQRLLRAPFLFEVKRFIAVSRANEHSQSTFLRLPSSRMVTIHNGIVVPPALPDRAAARGRLLAELGLPDDARLVAAIGRLSAQKGFDRLLRAAPAVLRAAPATRFVFVGDGELRGELEGQAKALGIESSVRWLGFRKDVPALLPGFDVLAMPSVFEGLPLVLLEAFAAGLPAVAHAVDGIPEVIDDDVNGFLTRPDATPELADRLARVLVDRELAERLSRAARAKAVTEFTVERMARETAAVYGAVARA
jgi:glycosyltransferase involved in cell wall biosynthesis